LTEPNAGDIALGCMRAFVGALADGGMTDACISPGSRSTPLVLALDREPRIRVHVHLDERSAGYVALGLAASSGRPVAAACTSGTAAVNLHPAVVEARQGGVPLLLLTADRPPELRGTGSNQTIDQVDLYGRYARLFVEAPVASLERGPWRALAARALDAARGGPGDPAAPVHLNLPFAEPLVPAGEPVEVATDDGPRAQAGPSIESLCAADARAVAARLAATERGVIVAGWMRDDPDAVLELAGAAGWPLVAEPASNARRPGALTAPQFVVEGRSADLVLLLGGLPTTRATQALVADAGSVITISPFDRVPMPGWSVDRHVRTDIAAVARAIARLAGDAPATAWTTGWTEADARARAIIDALLDAWDEPFEGRVARDIADGVPAGSTLFVGNSTPVRDLDLFMRPREGLRVLANRGASGIDGTVSTALGIAASGAQTYALLGDLAVLHDASGLLWAAGRGLDATIVVVNNHGGGIFDLLPSATLPEHEALFVTPHGIDLEALARAAGATYARVDRAQDLLGALEPGPGVRIIEVPIDRARAVAMRAQVRDTVARALAER